MMPISLYDPEGTLLKSVGRYLTAKGSSCETKVYYLGSADVHEWDGVLEVADLEEEAREAAAERGLDGISLGADLLAKELFIQRGGVTIVGLGSHGVRGISFAQSCLFQLLYSPAIQKLVVVSKDDTVLPDLWARRGDGVDLKAYQEHLKAGNVLFCDTLDQATLEKCLGQC